MKYIAGIDIGTSNIKGSIYDTEGGIVCSAQRAYESYTSHQNFHEQDPRDWIRGLEQVLKDLTSDKDIASNLEAISLSTQGGTVVPVDRNLKPVSRAITWLDRRGIKLLENSKELQQENLGFYDRTGWRLDSGMSFLPIYWLRENRKDFFNKIDKLMWVNDYVQKEICDNYYQDPSNASISLFYNVKKGSWDEHILYLLGVDNSYFSEVKNSGEPVGYLKPEFSHKLGLKSGVRVINGAHDQYCAALASGALLSSDILLATGTAWVIFKAVDRALLDRENFFSIGRFSYQKENMIEKFGLIYSIPSAGACIRWFAKNVMNLGQEEKLFKLIDAGRKEMQEMNNILFLPYLSGAFGPDFNPAQKASFINLELGHNHLHMIKAIMEGVGFQLKRILDLVAQKGIEMERLKLVGGGAKNRYWPQIISDITTLEVLVPAKLEQDLACRGAAILAGYGSGFFKSLEEGYKRLSGDYKRIVPNGQRIKLYRKKFKNFQRLNKQL